MHTFTASELVDLWEDARRRSPAQWGLALLTAAYPEQTPETLAELSIGRRNACLLQIRKRLFGSALASVAYCPNCGERLEFSFDMAEIWMEPAEEMPGLLKLSAEGYEVRYRLPNSSDLLALAGVTTAAEAAQANLLARCLVEVTQAGTAQTAADLPPTVIAAVVEGMAKADPQGDVQVFLTCSTCTHEWLASFDIVSYFASELDAWAMRILREVHELASAYGWREADILALSPQRRQIYLELIHG
jgi:hypothetical protein